MLDLVSAARLLTDHYGLADAVFHVLRAAPCSGIVQVDGASGQRAVLRLYSPAFPVHWFSDRPLTDWLRERASLLSALERLNYPAPRLEPTRDGALIASHEGWHALLLSYIAGTPADYSLRGLQLLGAALGALHTLAPPHPVGRAWWHPGHAVPTARRWLDHAAGTLPEHWIALSESARMVLGEAERFAALPPAVLHADVWPENAIRSATDQVTLIDWECAGWGPAVLDLGDLLLSVHYDASTITLNPRRIAAALAGYYQHRQLTAAEVAALPAAVRFSAAFHTALHVFRRIDDRWDDAATTRRLGRDESRMWASSGIARAALAWIAGARPPWTAPPSIPTSGRSRATAARRAATPIRPGASRARRQRKRSRAKASGSRRRR